jgi:fructokinase
VLEKKHLVVGVGELLWDLLPTGKQLGGAPANFAYITNLLGEHGIPASRIGSDPLGSQLVQHLSELGLVCQFIQQDAVRPTGTVNVTVDSAGQPCFDIAIPVAWDFLDWTPAWRQLAGKADAVCFGSLAQRSPQSRSTILNFVRATRPNAARVFDVNLRQNFYSKQVLADSMKLATIVKLNHEELPKVMRLFDLEDRGQVESAKRLLDFYGLKFVCVTRGADGSLLVTKDECCQHAGFRVKVVDTVGAGDAFTAALVSGYLRGASPTEINETANRVGAWVASQPGGTPPAPAGGLMQFLATMT